MAALLVVLPAVRWGLRVIQVGQTAKNVFNSAYRWQNQYKKLLAGRKDNGQEGRFQTTIDWTRNTCSVIETLDSP